MGAMLVRKRRQGWFTHLVVESARVCVASLDPHQARMTLSWECRLSELWRR